MAAPLSDACEQGEEGARACLSGGARRVLRVVALLLVAIFPMALAVFLRLPAASPGVVDELVRDAYLDETGRAYLPEADAYYHVRLAENLASSGSLGDSFAPDGTPWDSLRYAPEGHDALYQPGLPAIAVASWRVLGAFTSVSLLDVAYWLPCVMASLAALAAFVLCRRATNFVGGIVAGALVACASAFVARSVPGFFDTNVVAPLLAIVLMALLTEAMRARSLVGAAVLALAFALATEAFVQCWTVYGAMFAAVGLAGGLAFLALLSLARRPREAGFTRWVVRQGEPRGLLLCALACAVVLFALHGPALLEVALDRASIVTSFREGGVLPSLYVSVSELQVPALLPSNASNWLSGSFEGGTSITGGVGGGLVFLAAFLGLAAMFGLAAYGRLRRGKGALVQAAQSEPVATVARVGAATVAAQIEVAACDAAKSVVQDKLTPDEGAAGEAPDEANNGKTSSCATADETAPSKGQICEDPCGSGAEAGAPPRDEALNPRRLALYTCVLGTWLVACLYVALRGARFIEHLVAPVGILAGVFVGLAWAFAWHAAYSRLARRKGDKARDAGETGKGVVACESGKVGEIRDGSEIDEINETRDDGETRDVGRADETDRACSAERAGEADRADEVGDTKVTGKSGKTVIASKTEDVCAKGHTARSMLDRLRAIVPCLLAIALGLTLVIPAAFGAAKTSAAVRPMTSDATARAMAWISEHAETSEAVIASWWDAGYVYEYESGHPTLWDGGTLSPERAILMGRVLAGGDMDLSRDALLMLSSTGDAAISRLRAALGAREGHEALWDALPLNCEDACNVLVGTYGLDEALAAEIETLMHPLAPRETYLVISDKMLQALGWIEYYAAWDFEGRIPTPQATSYYMTTDGTGTLFQLDPAVQELFDTRRAETSWRLFFDRDPQGVDGTCFELVFETSDAVDHVQVWRVL